VHRALVEIGYYDRHPQALSDSYFATLRRLTQPAQELRTAGSALQ
jgi:hypothetical protein